MMILKLCFFFVHLHGGDRFSSQGVTMIRFYFWFYSIIMNLSNGKTLIIFLLFLIYSKSPFLINDLISLSKKGF